METGGDKEVPTPSEERRQRKQDTLEGISRTLGEFVDSPRYEDIGLDMEYTYKVQMVINKELYCRLLARKFGIEQCMKLFYWVLRIALKWQKKLYGLTLKNVPREIWRTFLRSSQANFPPKKLKTMDTVYLHDVLVSDFRLENTTASALYGTKNVPVLSKDDPIIWKLIRRAHISSEGIHRTFRGTFSDMVSGKFPVLCNQMSTNIKVFMRNCYQCLRWRQDRFKVALQPVYTAVKAKVLPF